MKPLPQGNPYPQEVSPLAARIAGAAMLILGVVFGFVPFFILYESLYGTAKPIEPADSIDPAEPLGPILILVLAVISLFCLMVGFRLTFHKPNQYSSILSPLGWSIVGCLFMLIFGFVLVEVYRGKISDVSWTGVGGALLLGLICFLNARCIPQLKPKTSIVTKDSHSQVES